MTEISKILNIVNNDSLTKEEKYDLIVKQNKDYIDTVIEIVAKYYPDVTVDSIKTNQSKHTDHVIPRQVCHFFILSKFKSHYSLAEIGRRVGIKDHATVLHSKKVIENYISQNKYFYNQIMVIEKEINEKYPLLATMPLYKAVDNCPDIFKKPILAIIDKLNNQSTEWFSEPKNFIEAKYLVNFLERNKIELYLCYGISDNFDKFLKNMDAVKFMISMKLQRKLNEFLQILYGK